MIRLVLLQFAIGISWLHGYVESLPRIWKLKLQLRREQKRAEVQNRELRLALARLRRVEALRRIDGLAAESKALWEDAEARRERLN